MAEVTRHPAQREHEVVVGELAEFMHDATLLPKSTPPMTSAKP